METTNTKCVMVIDENLPLGIITNTAAVMGVTLGKYLPQAVGADIVDQSGYKHLGIIEFPIPILKGNQEKIKALRTLLYEQSYEDVTVVDFSETAQSCNTYEEYTVKMAGTYETNLVYFGIAICGDKKKVNRLTGNMPLLR